MARVGIIHGGITMAIEAEVLHEFKPFLDVADQVAASSVSYKKFLLQSSSHLAVLECHYWPRHCFRAEQELCVRGNRVVWLEGLNPRVRTVKKVYSVETDILQAFWCQFSRACWSRWRRPREKEDWQWRWWREGEGKWRSADLCSCERAELFHSLCTHWSNLLRTLLLRKLKCHLFHVDCASLCTGSPHVANQWWPARWEAGLGRLGVWWSGNSLHSIAPGGRFLSSHMQKACCKYC